MPRGQSNASAQSATAAKAPQPPLVDNKDVLKLPDFYEREVWRFKLIGNQPAIFKIGNDDSHRAYNPKTKSYDNIRYCDNQNSIWVHEQHGVVRKGQTFFEDGLLEISKQETPQLEFIFRHRDFNKVFKLVDPEGDAKKELEEMRVSQEAATKAWGSSFKVLTQFAIALRLPSGNEPECRMAMVDYAKNNPVKFLSMFDDPLIQIIADLNRGLQEGILVSNDQGMKWHDGGTIIVVPTGHADVVGYVATHLVEPSTKNIAVLDKLRKELK